MKPYVGGGISFGHVSYKVTTPGLGNDSDFGLNVMGGLHFKAQDRFLPFVEARYEIKDGGQFILTAGAYFGKP